MGPLRSSLMLCTSELTWQMVVEGFLTCLFVDEPIDFWTQRGEHQAGIAKDPISILNGDNLFLLNLFCFPICKPSMPTLPTVCNYEKKSRLIPIMYKSVQCYPYSLPFTDVFVFYTNGLF